MADGYLMIYNIETNEIGYVRPDYYMRHGSTYNWTQKLDENGQGVSWPTGLYKYKTNLSFLADERNKWCVVRSDRLISHLSLKVTESRYTYPFSYIAHENDLYYVYYCKSSEDDTVLPGSTTINYTVDYTELSNINTGFEEHSITGTSTSNLWGRPSYVPVPPNYYRKSIGFETEVEAINLLLEIDRKFTERSDYVIKNVFRNQAVNGSMPIAFVDSNYTASQTKYCYLAVVIPFYCQRTSFGTWFGLHPPTNFDINSAWNIAVEPGELYTMSNCVYYDSETLPSILNSYITRNFGGDQPTYKGDLTDYLKPTESIYTPGGDTTDPYNPYPSGPSPYTDDPLDSGLETDSPDTDGTWELPFDNVPDSPATVHSVDLGLYNAYALTAVQVSQLANYLFSGVTEVGENLVKLIWGSKVDVIISLMEFPLMVAPSGSDNVRFIFDTDLAGFFTARRLTNEYLPINFGTIEVPRYSGTFYDFEPYTTLTLYIPYIGYIDLKPTEVIGSTLTISGYIHLTTGEITINVKSSRTGILGSYSGTIGRLLPIADADATEIYSAIIKTAAALGAVAVAGVGAASASSAAGAVSAPSHHAVDVAQAEYQNTIKDWGTATKGIRGKQAEMMNKGVSYEATVANYNEQRSKYNQVNKASDNAREDFHDALSEAGSNAIGAVTTGFNVSRGTVMTSSNGRLSPQRCFLRIEVPHQNVSRNQKILGYPANSSDSLNSDRLHGYTELRAIELSIPRATLTELQELENILKGGFYLP